MQSQGRGSALKVHPRTRSVISAVQSVSLNLECPKAVTARELSSVVTALLVAEWERVPVVTLARHWSLVGAGVGVSSLIASLAGVTALETDGGRSLSSR